MTTRRVNRNPIEDLLRRMQKFERELNAFENRKVKNALMVDSAALPAGNEGDLVVANDQTAWVYINGAWTQLGGGTGTSGDWDAVVYKTADEDVTSSVTLQNDNELFFAMTSGHIYIVEMIFVYSSPVGGGTPDIKLFISASGGSTGAATFHSFSTADADNPAAGFTSATFTAGTATTKRLGIFRGHQIAGSSINYQVQWAQNTSSANATRVHTNSFLRYKDIS